MIKAVLFDLDGTLINSLDDLADSVNHTLEQFSFPTHETEKFKYFIGNGMRKLIERALPDGKEEFLEEVLAAFLIYYKSHSLDKTAPYRDIDKLLIALKERNIVTAIVTNKADAAAQVICDYFFKGSIDLVYGQRDGVPTKPDPALVNLALENLELSPKECLFVGDSGMDMLVAVNSGTVPVGVTWGFRTKEELISNGAKHIINSPLELLKLVD